MRKVVGFFARQGMPHIIHIIHIEYLIIGLDWWMDIWWNNVIIDEVRVLFVLCIDLPQGLMNWIGFVKLDVGLDWIGLVFGCWIYWINIICIICIICIQVSIIIIFPTYCRWIHSLIVRSLMRIEYLLCMNNKKRIYK